MKQETIRLPEITLQEYTPLTQLLRQRRSLREYRTAALNLSEIGQLLWAAQGISHRDGYRTAPSAGALYPLELYVVVGEVAGLEAGVYHYLPNQHRLRQTLSGDLRTALTQAALGQSCLSDAAAVVVFAAVYERTTHKYGERGLRYVDIEVGHAAENLFLQAEALGLGTVVVGAFDDDEMQELLQFAAEQQVRLLMPVGKL